MAVIIGGTALFITVMWLIVMLATQFTIIGYALNILLFTLGAALLVYGAYDIGKDLIK
jgi:hypothetical protein